MQKPEKPESHCRGRVQRNKRAGPTQSASARRYAPVRSIISASVTNSSAKTIVLVDLDTVFRPVINQAGISSCSTATHTVQLTFSQVLTARLDAYQFTLLNPLICCAVCITSEVRVMLVIQVFDAISACESRSTAQSCPAYIRDSR